MVGVAPSTGAGVRGALGVGWAPGKWGRGAGRTCKTADLHEQVSGARCPCSWRGRGSLGTQGSYVIPTGIPPLTPDRQNRMEASSSAPAMKALGLVLGAGRGADSQTWSGVCWKLPQCHGPGQPGPGGPSPAPPRAVSPGPAPHHSGPPVPPEMGGCGAQERCPGVPRSVASSQPPPRQALTGSIGSLHPAPGPWGCASWPDPLQALSQIPPTSPTKGLSICTPKKAGLIPGSRGETEAQGRK